MLNIYKKGLSFVLSLVLILSSFSLVGFSKSTTAYAEDNDGAYLFAYFTGNLHDEQRICFAVSKDGLSYDYLNNNNPIIEQTKGTLCARDPYIFMGQDGYYYLIATDMTAENGWDNYVSKTFVYWRSKDLLNWQDETIINVEEILERDGNDYNVGKAWAPQVFFDVNTQKYIVYFGLDCPEVNPGHVWTYYMFADDLLDQNTYSTPQLMLKGVDDRNAIDADLWLDDETGTYYLYYKDENNATICYATATSPTGPYTFQSRIFGDGMPALEGCNAFMRDGTLTMIADAYASGFFVLSESNDYKNFRLLNEDEYAINHTKPRHGSIISISNEQYDALVKKWGITYNDKFESLPKNHSNKDIASSLVAEYFTQEDVTKDTSGNGNNLTMDGKVEWWKAEDHTGTWGSYGKDCAFFNDTDYLVATDLYKNAGINYNDGFAISFYGFNFQETNRDTSRFFDLTTKQNCSWSDDTDYLFFANSNKTGIKKSGVPDVNKANGFMYTREWHHYIVSAKGKYVYTYVDGKLISMIAYSDGLEADWYNRMQNADLLIGKSAWSADQPFDGLLYQMRVFNKALTPDDINKFDDVKKEYIENCGFKEQSANAKGYFVNDVAKGYYSNLLYSQQNNVTWIANGRGGTLTENSMQYKLAVPAKTVALYDGKNEITIPLKVEFTAPNRDRFIHYIDSNTNGFTYKNKWKLVGDSDNSYLYWNPDSNQHYGDGDAGYSSNTVGNSKTFNVRGWHAFYLNRAYIEPVFNDSYYNKTTSLSVKFHYATSNNASSSNYTSTLTNNNVGIYVINYKPILDILPDAKAKYEALKDNEILYTEESVKEFYNAIYKLVKFNPNNYAYASDTENAVIKCSNSIKDIVDSYNNAKLVKANRNILISYSSNSGLNKNESITISNNTNGEIEYNLEYSNGITLTRTTTESIITIIPFANNDSATVTVKARYVGNNPSIYNGYVNTIYALNYKPQLVYQESFEDASFDGSIFTSSNGSGTLANNATGSIVPLAGAVDRGPNASSIRQNVLKLNANEQAPGNFLKLESNPLVAVSSTAKEHGVTISFWRHMEQNGATTTLAERAWDSTGYVWRNALSFQENGNNTHFYQMEVNGVTSRCETAGVNYVDTQPEYNDKTVHGSSNLHGEWINITYTINPNNGEIITYVNGVPRQTARINKQGTYASMTDREIAQEVISFLTKDNTGFYFNNGVAYEGNDYDIFLDDIRIYTGVLNQLEINEMFSDEQSDTPNQTSITHDPTNVTVYTLKAGTYTAANGSSEAVTIPFGKTVGEEFINYYGVDVKTQIEKIEYYSFGTGMVIEKSTDGVHWTKIGDKKGGFAYQNEDLFGSKYTDALIEPLKYAKGDGAGDGAGYLLWAPHVMYNLSLNKWVYYGATSSWGSQRSAIFYCTSDSVYDNYQYQEMVYQSVSNDYGNAIDADAYYGYDANGIIDKSQLYLAYGSWGWMVNCKEITIWGRRIDATTGGKFAKDNYLFTDGSDYRIAQGDPGSGEGAYVIYRNGYYYLYQTYGLNDGTYTECYLRSTSPTGPFERYDGAQATSSTGMFFMGSYYLDDGKYVYWSNGHNSVYTVYNENGDELSVNVAHSRALSYNGSTTTETGMLMTCQTTDGGGYMAGNIAISNLIAFTKSGWNVMFPLQYNGTDTTVGKFAINDIVGSYKFNNLNTIVTNGTSSAQSMKVTKIDNDEVQFDFGDKTYTAKLEYGKDYANQDITYITGDEIEGVIAKQGDIFEFSFFNKETLQHTWGYQLVHKHIYESTVTGDNNVYAWHSVCSTCGNEETRVVDINAYNSAVALAEVEISNDVKYTESSKNELSTYIKKLDLTANSNLTQNDVDILTSNLTSANNLQSNGGVLELKNYDVTFITVKNDVEYTSVKPVEYGTSTTLSVDDSVYKWTIENDTQTTKLDCSNSDLELVVYNELTVVAYVAENNIDSTAFKITVLGNHQRVTDVKYASNNADLSSLELNFQIIPFYTIVGYKINGISVQNLNDLKVTGDMVIKPIYTAK